MMKLKDFKYIFFLFFFILNAEGQNIVFGVVSDSTSNIILDNVKIVDNNGLLIVKTDSNGYYFFTTTNDAIDLNFVKDGYSLFSKTITFNKFSELEFNVSLFSQTRNLEEISVFDKKNEVFDTRYLKDVSNYSINSGKKNEVILSDSKNSKAINSARHMYNQTVSLNIIQTDEAGLQLNIGGRGLNPRRTSNFNVRQNGYVITPDPLGYPESYYTPPFESLENIEIIRGGASLQYGTQFGGLLNFNIKMPKENENIDLTIINTLSSYNIFTNFSHLLGKINRFSYSSFFKHMKGEGFRPNSDFESNNFFIFLSRDYNSKLSASFELTYLNYLAHQPGGLTDQMFNTNIYQSNRERNWFEINWLLYNFKLSYNFSDRTSGIFSVSYLDAYRFSLGFRSNRVDQIDSFEERDLIKSDFNNLSVESKLIHNYEILNKRMVFLIGSRLFNGNNYNQQGPGSDDSNADFNYYSATYPNYPNQSFYSNPNFNYSLFSENIIYLNNKVSLTPGMRFEYIKTESDGYFRKINTDAAGNVILNDLIYNNEIRERSFLLLGLGCTYKFLFWSELYSNISQNYRAVTFADINTVNPNFIIDPDIIDENGYTFDLGLRGVYKDFVSYDFSLFYLFYNNRIGFVQKEVDGLVKNEKGNVGDAEIIGQEILINFNIHKILNMVDKYRFKYFLNFSNLSSSYVKSDVNGVEGNKLEFVPTINLKTGFQIGYKNIKADLQYTFMSNQFSDATNSIDGDIAGIIGEIPQYSILDISFFYFFKKYFNIEWGIHNLLDEHYFTTRATGYPGPGIIPATPRNYYISIQYKL